MINCEKNHKKTQVESIYFKEYLTVMFVVEMGVYDEIIAEYLYRIGIVSCRHIVLVTNEIPSFLPRNAL